MKNTNSTQLLTASAKNSDDRDIITLDVVHDNTGNECYMINCHDDHGHRMDTRLYDIAFDRSTAIKTFAELAKDNDLTIEENIVGVLHSTF